MKKETVKEFFERKSKLKSPFEATNKELADSRFCDDVDFKSKEEEKYFCSLPDSIAGDEIKRLTIGMEKFGYDNKKKLNDLNKS
ncbi:hypothetical protein [Peptoniphilus sp. BV3C26]|uniref:hypothetical protein n=1 Tax=Peptoniphilus sp. BV3C26 TaxID=1111134 RepID=UPI0003B87BB0|nr:hypothetical protein [Peptoniphilus sp. BV3C26]ERT59008.1 hypothetical protein HMPREF1253_1976 [Peptoniphilus sp. BV3C26]